jgi:hypothetical protein
MREDLGMYCSNCSAPVESDDDERCGTCGADLSDVLRQSSPKSSGERLQAVLKIAITLAGALAVAARIVNDQMQPAHTGNWHSVLAFCLHSHSRQCA